MALREWEQAGRVAMRVGIIGAAGIGGYLAADRMVDGFAAYVGFIEGSVDYLNNITTAASNVIDFLSPAVGIVAGGTAAFFANRLMNR